MIKGKTRRNRSDYQLDEWVKGNPIHNDIDDECCPDFSCCNENISDENTRILFKNSDGATRQMMLMGFLGNAIANHTDKKVHIAGTMENQA